MRLRRKPWIEESIKQYTSILFLEEPKDLKGKWSTQFAHPEKPIHVEFGTGKGQFISGMADIHRMSITSVWKCRKASFTMPQRK